MAGSDWPRCVRWRINGDGVAEMSEKSSIPPVDDQPSASSGTAARHPDETGQRRPICVDLTDEQRKALKPLFYAAAQASDAGLPGMLVAQVFAYDMRVGFVSHEQARILTDDQNARVWSAASAQASQASRSSSDHPGAIPGTDANATQAE